MNNKFAQVQGPFSAGQEIVSLIMKDVSDDFTSIVKIGVQSKVGHQFKMNDCTFEIGKTGILEFNDVDITSLSFLQDEDDSTIVDCIID
jgi:hypothetical protein